jgi:cohesin loading factor subunit SCC2
MASVLRPVGLASSDEYDETNVSEDALERAARTKFPSRTQEAKALNSSEFDLARFVVLCRQGAALALLLRLKLFLRRLYNLSETRCLEYDPNAKDRVGEKAVSRSDSVKPFDARIALSDRTKDVDKDALIRYYAEFRRLMRDETGSSSDINNESSNMSDDMEDEKKESSPPRKRSAEQISPEA